MNKNERHPMNKKLKAKIVVVTPEMAASWLSNKMPNRAIQKAPVRSWLSAMRSEHWQTGIPLLFNAEGRLIDGQHRLTALVQFGAPLEFLVVENADDALMRVLDIGAKRDARDVVVIAGITDVRDHATWTRTILMTIAGSEPSHDAVCTYIPKIRDALDAVTPALSGRRGGLRRAGLAAAFVVGWHDVVLRPRIADMARRYVENDKLEVHTGLWHMERRGSNSGGAGSNAIRDDMAFALRCIEIERDGEVRKSLRPLSDFAPWRRLLPEIGSVR